MGNPWNGKVVLEAFWWNCWNGNYQFDWYTYLAKLAPRLTAIGFDGIWTPPPCKGTDAHNDMGYTPYDYYDIGQKNQKSAVETRFGTMDSFLRLVAVAHANGLEVYPDIVLDHCSGGDPDPSSPFQSGSQQFTNFHPNGFAGPGMGRWSRNWLDFHYNPQHWAPVGDWSPVPVTKYGADFCYQGQCTDSGNGDPNCAARRNARAWLTWFVKQTGIDGFRFDDVDGYPAAVVEDLLYNAMGPGLEYFAVGEYVTIDRDTVDSWAGETLNRCGTFDYPLRFALANMVQSGGFSDVGNLPFKTVPFINNHDTADHQVGPFVDPDNPRTAAGLCGGDDRGRQPSALLRGFVSEHCALGHGHHGDGHPDPTVAGEPGVVSPEARLQERRLLRALPEFAAVAHLWSGGRVPSWRSTTTASRGTTHGSPPPSSPTPGFTTTAGPAPATSGRTAMAGRTSTSLRLPTPCGARRASRTA
jgi:hypothetical protein